VHKKVPVDKINISSLQQTLHQQGAILHLDERSKEGPEPPH